MKWLLACVLVGALGCAKKDEAPPVETKPPPIPAAELARGQDACKAYVEQICGCAATVEAAQQPCTLAKALPDAIEVAMQVAVNPDAKPKDALQAADSIRKTIAQCIEQTAQLPALGCQPAR